MPAGSTISTAVYATVTLGSGFYPTKLTISPKGAVEPTATGSTGVYSHTAKVSLMNEGKIAGAYGGYGAGSGGVGVLFLASGSVTNSGVIAAGEGGADGGAGGAGVSLASGKLTNTGRIAGGRAQYDSVGGAGVVLGSGTLVDSGAITGGAGGAYYKNQVGGAGGAGVSVGVGTMTNSGTVAGGAGGLSYGSPPYDGAIGGVGISLAGGKLTNTGLIEGGAGGNNNAFLGAAGDGGVGVAMAGGIVRNQGTITGGAGGGGDGVYAFPGQGGTGMDIAGGTVTNQGTISGGAGGYGQYGNGSTGGTGVVLTKGSLTNAGLIVGGQGAGSYYESGPGGVGLAIYGGVAASRGVIIGGAGSNDYSGSGGNGGAGVFLDGGTFIATEAVSGGAGGYGFNAAEDGAAGDAVLFGSVASTLAISVATKFTGDVVANSGVNDVLELTESYAATLTGLGSALTGFTTVDEAAGTNWVLAGANALGAGTTLLDAGKLTVTGTLTDAGAATISGAGLLDAKGPVQIDRVTLAGGTLDGGPTGTIVVGTTLAGAAPTVLTVQAGATLSGFGTIEGLPVLDDGNIVAQHGTLTMDNVAVSGTGTVTISSGATAISGELLVPTLVFGAGGDATLDLVIPSSFISTNVGFASGDVIDLEKLVATTLSFLGGTLTLDNGNTLVDQLYFAGGLTKADFALQSDGHGGTDVVFAGAAAPDGVGGALASAHMTGFEPMVPVFARLEHFGG
jgi:hypothetical protein